MATEAPFRELLQHAIGGGWGDETPSPGSLAVRVIRGTDFSNILSGTFDEVPRRYEARSKAERRLLHANDIVLEISGGSRTSNQSTGRTLFITQDILDRLVQPVIPASFCRLVRVRDDVVVPRYAYYALQEMHLSGRAGLYEHHSTGISNFQFEYFLDEELVWLPPLSEQRTVAHILGTLDDKIELNRRVNETLEAMVRALFKSWFVDFDPVRAKAEGRHGGLPDHVGDLFPGRLVNSELGEVPEGWEVTPIASVVELNRDGVEPQEFVEEVFDHYSIPAFDDGCTPIRERGEAIKSRKYLVVPDSVLLSKLNPRIRRVWLPRPNDQRRSIASTEFLVLTPIDPWSTEYLYCLLSSNVFARRFTALVTGTSGSHQRVRPKAFLALHVVHPPEALVRQFTTIVALLLGRVAQGRAESETLAALRDTLLPRLVSGEIRVNDPGRFMAKAV